MPLVTNLDRSWESLRGMISSVFSLSTVGARNVMVDGCGSIGKLDEELCARWMQAAAFMPMVRLYYQVEYISKQGELAFSDPGNIFDFTSERFRNMAASAVRQRQRFSLYLYSQMFDVTDASSPMVAPLFYYVPFTAETLRDPEHTYIVGEAIKVSPVLTPESANNGTYEAYFQPGFYVNLNNFTDVLNVSDPHGTNVTLNASDEFTNIHMLAGSIIPYQSPVKPSLTWDLQYGCNTNFYVFRDPYLDSAYGSLLIDDGYSPAYY